MTTIASNCTIHTQVMVTLALVLEVPNPLQTLNTDNDARSEQGLKQRSTLQFLSSH